MQCKESNNMPQTSSVITLVPLQPSASAAPTTSNKEDGPTDFQEPREWQRFYQGYKERFVDDCILPLRGGRVTVHLAQAPSAHVAAKRRQQPGKQLDKSSDPALTGTTVWDGAVVLAQYLTQCPESLQPPCGAQSAVATGNDACIEACTSLHSSTMCAATATLGVHQRAGGLCTTGAAAGRASASCAVLATDVHSARLADASSAPVGDSRQQKQPKRRRQQQLSLLEHLYSNQAVASANPSVTTDPSMPDYAPSSSTAAFTAALQPCSLALVPSTGKVAEAAAPPVSPAWSGSGTSKPHVLELGAGTGAVSLALLATGMAASATITDLKDLLPHLTLNVQRNLSTLSARGASGSAAAHIKELRWGRADDLQRLSGPRGPPFDVVVGSDLIYYSFSRTTPHSKLLLWTLRRVASPSTRIYLSLSLHHNPGEVKGFLTAAEEHFQVTCCHEDVPEEWRVPDVTVVRLQLLQSLVPGSAEALEQHHELASAL